QCRIIRFHDPFLWYAFLMPHDRADASSQSRLGQRIWWLIFGRAAAVILLLVVGTGWKQIAPGVAFVKPGSSVTPLILAVVGLTIVFVAVRLNWKNYLAQARLQF